MKRTSRTKGKNHVVDVGEGIGPESPFPLRAHHLQLVAGDAGQEGGEGPADFIVRDVASCAPTHVVVEVVVRHVAPFQPSEKSFRMVRVDQIVDFGESDLVEFLHAACSVEVDHHAPEIEYDIFDSLQHVGLFRSVVMACRQLSGRMHRAGPGFGFQRCSSLKFPTDFSRLQELFGGGLVLSTVVPLSWFVRPTCPLRRLFVRSVSGYSFVCSSSGCAVGVLSLIHI